MPGAVTSIEADEILYGMVKVASVVEPDDRVTTELAVTLADVET